MQFCQELVQNLHFLWFPESAHLSGGFVKKSEKSVKKLQNTVVKMKKKHFFQKNRKKVKIEILKISLHSITHFYKKALFFSF